MPLKATVIFSDGDLVRYNPTTGLATLLLSEEIFSGGSDIDAVHALEVDGKITRLILSTDGPGTINGVLYDDGDLIEIIPGTNADLAMGQLGTGAVVRRFLSESVFKIGAVAGDPTENIDAVFIDPAANIALSTNSGAAFDGFGAAFQNGDLVQLSAGRNAMQLLFEEVPDAGRTFYGETAGYRAKAPPRALLDAAAKLNPDIILHVRPRLRRGRPPTARGGRFVVILPSFSKFSLWKSSTSYNAQIAA